MDTGIVCKYFLRTTAGFTQPPHILAKSFADIHAAYRHQLP
jgi:hypothetical protein